MPEKTADHFGLVQVYTGNGKGKTIAAQFQQSTDATSTEHRHG
jgi:ATP:corrinoid adenosyltransferase